MKTETQEQLEKEIEEQKKNFDKLADFVKPQVTERLKYLEVTGMNLKEKKAKLSQHKTDIKNFEKLLKDKGIFIMVGAYNPEYTKGRKELAEEIKEALKEL